MKVRNPYTGEYDYELKVDDAASIQKKAAGLRANQKQWQNAGVVHRAKVLQDWKASIQKYQEEITEKLAEDTGRNYISKYEVIGVMGMIDGWCYKAPLLLQEKEERASLFDPNVKIREKGIAYQMVGVIGPWNFPITLSLIDAIPALMAGSSVLLKPSEVTPRYLDPLEKSIKEVPELAKVLALVRGGSEVGKAVVNTADAICFTGSVNTGKHIAAAAAPRLIPAFLELGGKDPAVVLADSDLEIATDAVLRSGVGATGQACQSLERVYVQESIYDAFLEMIVAKAKKVTLNAEDKSKGQMGPLIFEPQAKAITAQLADAKAKGAIVHCGGVIENHGGLWCPPTILSNVSHDMKVMTEETFGPLLPIMSFKTEEEAILLANDSEFGLSASLFSSDEKAIERVAYQLEAGAISINDGSLTNKIYDAEKNAFKKSGLNGSRMGDAGLLRFFRKRALLIQTGKPSPMSSFEEIEL
ncbi:aldehyde dehydrogenase family protein [Maribacter sp.]|nr:aldehyde dehydrogenase family protein [Maribacter sp.]